MKFRVPFLNPLFDLINNEVNDKKIDFDNRLLKLMPNSNLKGYWQTFSYYLDLVKNNLVPTIDLKKPSPEYEFMKNRILSEKLPISIHIRRGDYKTATDLFGLLGFKYYEEAVKLAHTKDASYFVFSDTMNEAKEILEPLKLQNITFVENLKNPAEDLLMMSFCKINIIANSTFSMWGAVINPNGRAVIAPSPQFVNSKIKDVTIPNAKLINPYFS